MLLLGIKCESNLFCFRLLNNISWVIAAIASSCKRWVVQLQRNGSQNNISVSLFLLCRPWTSSCTLWAKEGIKVQCLLRLIHNVFYCTVQLTTIYEITLLWPEIIGPPLLYTKCFMNFQNGGSWSKNLANNEEKPCLSSMEPISPTYAARTQNPRHRIKIHVTIIDWRLKSNTFFLLKKNLLKSLDISLEGKQTIQHFFEF